jgi:flagellar protein FlaG
MAEQVNPVGGLAPGLPIAFVAATKPQPPPDKPRAAKPAEPQPKRQGDPSVDPSAEAVDAAASAFHDFFKETSANLVFQVDKSTGQFVFKVVDATTQEVIRQVPSEEVLAMARKLRELSNPKDASGVLVDQEG